MPLRFVSQDTYSVGSERIIVGRVVSGTLRKGDKLIFQPSGTKAEIEAIKFFPVELEEAHSGDSIGIVINGEVTRGDVGGLLAECPVSTHGFLGEVVLLEGFLRQDDQFQIKCAFNTASCKVEVIKQRMSSETGEVMATNVSEIGQNEAALVVLKTEPMVIEKFSDIPELGRFILVKNGKNVGAGIVLEIRQ